MKAKILTTVLIGFLFFNVGAQTSDSKVKSGLLLIEKLDSTEYTELIHNNFIISKKEKKIAETWILHESFKNYETLKKEYEVLELNFKKQKFNHEFLNSEDLKNQQTENKESNIYFIKPTATFFEDGNYLGLKHSFILVNYKNETIFDEGAKRLAKRIRKQ